MQIYFMPDINIVFPIANFGDNVYIIIRRYRSKNDASLWENIIFVDADGQLFVKSRLVINPFNE